MFNRIPALHTWPRQVKILVVGLTLSLAVLFYCILCGGSFHLFLTALSIFD